MDKGLYLLIEFTAFSCIEILHIEYSLDNTVVKYQNYIFYDE